MQHSSSLSSLSLSTKPDFHDDVSLRLLPSSSAVATFNDFPAFLSTGQILAQNFSAHSHSSYLIWKQLSEFWFSTAILPNGKHEKSIGGSTECLLVLVCTELNLHLFWFWTLGHRKRLHVTELEKQPNCLRQIKLPWSINLQNRNW